MCLTLSVTLFLLWSFLLLLLKLTEPVDRNKLNNKISITMLYTVILLQFKSFPYRILSQCSKNSGFPVCLI